MTLPSSTVTRPISWSGRCGSWGTIPPAHRPEHRVGAGRDPPRERRALAASAGHARRVAGRVRPATRSARSAHSPRPGALTEEDALDLVIARGRAMAEARAGAMVAVRADADAAAPVAEAHDWVVANDNAPGQVVLSGPADRADDLHAALRAAGLRAMRFARHRRLPFPAHGRTRPRRSRRCSPGRHSLSPPSRCSAVRRRPRSTIRASNSPRPSPPRCAGASSCTDSRPPSHPLPRRRPRHRDRRARPPHACQAERVAGSVPA